MNQRKTLMSDTESVDSYELMIEKALENSCFNDDNITIGAAHEWQWLVDAIRKYAQVHNQTHVIIHTGLIQHNINVPMIDLYNQGHHEVDDNFTTTMGKVSVITGTVDKIEEAILDFQQLAIVKEVAKVRSCMGPNVHEPYSYFRYREASDETREMQVKLSWDS